MKLFFLLFISAALCSGCVSHKSCRVTATAGHTDVEVRRDWYGLVPGICGFTSHVRYDYTFRIDGEKTVYRGDELERIPAKKDSTPYEGSLSLFRDRKRVIVKLSEHGYPFDLNGTYHYR